jgi:histidine phosphotransferase ChpT
VGDRLPALDAMTIQAYYTWRLAGNAGMRLDVVPDGADVLLSARP